MIETPSQHRPSVVGLPFFLVLLLDIESGAWKISFEAYIAFYTRGSSTLTTLVILVFDAQDIRGNL